MDFKLVSDYHPAGDQVQAIEKIVNQIKQEKNINVTLLGVTGSGKTFTVANSIQKLNKPTLVISHNKTLSAQLYREFKNYFPHNAVEYFVSNFDYYQPEAYLPKRDLYIEKDSSINDEIDRLRLKATESLLSRNDVIVVATVSCIYGIGNPDEYKNQRIYLEQGKDINFDNFLRQLVDIYYERSEYEFSYGNFRIKGDVIDIFPAYSINALRIILFGDEIEELYLFEPISGKRVKNVESFYIYPAKHFVTNPEYRENALKQIENELQDRVDELRNQGKELEASRLLSRTRYDIEMIREVGYVKGAENYSRHFSGRKPGQQAATLMDYFPDDFLLVIDESHVTVPQLHAMYFGDKSRKESLVEYGFRLPSAKDHRPLKFYEFEKYMNNTIFVSATPSNYEKEHSSDIIEQIIRPTGLLDPIIEVRKSDDQIPDLMNEIEKRIEAKERILVLTLTKRNSEDLSQYFEKNKISAKYLHSEIDTLERIEIIRDFREGKFDVLVGINLLREGLDLPEVSLVAILDSDKVGFLRSETSLMQMMGRAARNVEGKIIMYADKISPPMRAAINETTRRRKIQMKYNQEHGITPKTINKKIESIIEREKKEEENDHKDLIYEELINKYNVLIPKEKKKLIKVLTDLMKEESKKWNFEQAIFLRDKIEEIKNN